MSKCYTSCFLFFFTLGVVFSEVFASGYPPTPYNNPTQPKAVPHPNAMSALDPSLLDAASRNDTNQVKSLIEKGARVNATNAGGLTPLHWAAMNKNLDLIKFLVGKGANLNAKALSGATPLKKAQDRGQAEAIKALETNSASSSS